MHFSVGICKREMLEESFLHITHFFVHTNPNCINPLLKIPLVHQALFFLRKTILGNAFLKFTIKAQIGLVTDIFVETHWHSLIKDSQRFSELLWGSQSFSEVLRASLRFSEALRGSQRLSKAFKGSQRLSKLFKVSIGPNKT